ncbi:hypothetical protein AVEN_153757-1 [Araneus ventricosus]|uniref:DUF4817 domain-containing protein n=1 Tax=Araneus ventricosus TaxID=182803 RepID=A0A4Y2KR13_ARAVE|nr:hypothetical protein AVEN_153757-1 [Araneus ventricosus]
MLVFLEFGKCQLSLWVLRGNFPLYLKEELGRSRIFRSFYSNGLRNQRFKRVPLTKEERIYIILLAGSGTTRLVVCTFNATHRMQITHGTAAKLITKFKTTGSIADESRSAQRQPEMKVRQHRYKQRWQKVRQKGSDVSLGQ